MCAPCNTLLVSLVLCIILYSNAARRPKLKMHDYCLKVGEPAERRRAWTIALHTMTTRSFSLFLGRRRARRLSFAERPVKFNYDNLRRGPRHHAALTPRRGRTRFGALFVSALALIGQPRKLGRNRVNAINSRVLILSARLAVLADRKNYQKPKAFKSIFCDAAVQLKFISG